MSLRRDLEGVEASPSSRETVGTGLPGPRKDQCPLILSIVGGLDHTESAEKLGKSPSPGGLHGRALGHRWVL